MSPRPSRRTSWQPVKPGTAVAVRPRAAVVKAETRQPPVFVHTYGEPNAEKILTSFEQYCTLAYGGNAVAFGLLNVDMRLFSEARLCWRNLKDKKLSYDAGDLSKLERPWPNGFTGELLARMKQDAGIAGNAYVRDCGYRLERLRPDWVTIVSWVTTDDHGHEVREVIGYMFEPDGDPEREPLWIPVEQMAHWAPIPDPLANWRGMSVLTPALRELNADLAMTTHRESYFRKAATPNIIIKYSGKITPSQKIGLAESIAAKHGGPDKAGGTLVLDEGADPMIVGAKFSDAEFSAVLSAVENRIAVSVGVPALLAGLKEGLDAAAWSMYRQALRAYADMKVRPEWRSACSSLSVLVDVPDGEELWYDTRDISALQESEKESADRMQITVSTIVSAIQGGFEWQSAVDAVSAGDETLLKHTGLVSVQLLPPGPQTPPPGEDPAMPEPDGPPEPPIAADEEEDVDRALVAGLLDQLSRSQASTERLLDRVLDMALDSQELERGRSRKEIFADLVQAGRVKRDGEGQFSRAGAIAKALLSGEPNALDGFSREQLRREARKRNIDLPRGASEDHIKDALWEHEREGVDDEADLPAAEKAELDLTRLKVPELREKAKAAGIKGYSKMRKAELVGALMGDSTPITAPNGPSLPDRIVDLYHALVDRPTGYVQIAEVRERLKDVDWPTIKAELQRLDTEKVIYLVGDPNRKAITKKARAAAVDVGGEEKHLITIPRGYGKGPSRREREQARDTANADKATKDETPNPDGLDSLDDPRLRSLALEYEVATGDRKKMLAGLREAGAVSPEVAKTRREADAAAETERMPARIADAYMRLKHPDGDWVSLTSLRREIGGSHEDQDRTLMTMVREGKIRLIPEENRKTITTEDKAAALNVSGEDKHLIGIFGDDGNSIAKPSDSPATSPLRNRIGEALEKLRLASTGAQADTDSAWFYLADLRDALPDVPRQELDAELLKLSREKGKIALIPASNQKVLTQRHRDAAIDKGGESKNQIRLLPDGRNELTGAKPTTAEAFAARTGASLVEAFSDAADTDGPKIRQLMASMSKEELAEVARQLPTVTKPRRGDSRKTLEDNLFEGTVGFRQRSAAIGGWGDRGKPIEATAPQETAAIQSAPKMTAAEVRAERKRIKQVAPMPTLEERIKSSQVNLGRETLFGTDANPVLPAPAPAPSASAKLLLGTNFTPNMQAAVSAIYEEGAFERKRAAFQEDFSLTDDEIDALEVNGFIEVDDRAGPGYIALTPRGEAAIAELRRSAEAAASPEDYIARSLRELEENSHDGGHLWWTKDPEGLAKWATHEHPWTALHRHVITWKGMTPEKAKRITSDWYREVFGHMPNEGLHMGTDGHYAKRSDESGNSEDELSRHLPEKHNQLDHGRKGKKAIQAVVNAGKAQGGKAKADPPTSKPAPAKPQATQRKPRPADMFSKKGEYHNIDSAWGQKSTQGELEPGQQELAKAAYGGTYAGLTVADVQIVQASKDSLGVTAAIRDSNGKEVGHVSRFLHTDGKGRVFAQHDELVLDQHLQGQGFAQAYNQSLTEWYRANGVDRIELNANKDVGAYAWARAGYDWADEDGAMKIAGQLRRFAQLGSNMIPKERRAEQRALALRLAERFGDAEFGDADYPTPYEVSQLGRWEGAGKDDWWIGKRALWGASWDGVKHL